MGRRPGVANAPLFASSTAALAYALDPGTGAIDPYAVSPGYLAAPDVPIGTVLGEDDLAYSAVPDEEADAHTVAQEPLSNQHIDSEHQRWPLVLVGSILAVVFVAAVCRWKWLWPLGSGQVSRCCPAAAEPHHPDSRARSGPGERRRAGGAPDGGAAAGQRASSSSATRAAGTATGRGADARSATDPPSPGSGASCGTRAGSRPASAAHSGTSTGAVHVAPVYSPPPAPVHLPPHRRCSFPSRTRRPTCHRSRPFIGLRPSSRFRSSSRPVIQLPIPGLPIRVPIPLGRRLLRRARAWSRPAGTAEIRRAVRVPVALAAAIPAEIPVVSAAVTLAVSRVVSAAVTLAVGRVVSVAITPVVPRRFRWRQPWRLRRR